MVITLYEALKDVERLKKDQERSAKDLLEKLQSRRTQLGLPDTPLEVVFPSVDVPSAQREVFKQYGDNIDLKRAISGNLPLEDAVITTHLRFRIRGRIGSLFPYKKNEAHNKMVEGLSELVPKTNMLRTKGILSFDNAINVATVAASGVFGIFYFLAKMAESVHVGDSDYEREMDAFFNYVPYILPGLAAFCSGAFPVSYRSESFDTTLEAAHYIDDKIKELGLYKK